MIGFNGGSLLRLAVTLAVLSAATSSSATVPADLCTGNPCTVTTSKTIDSGSVLDFGAATDLVINSGVILRLGAGAVPRVMTIMAGSITLRPNAQIIGDPSGNSNDGNDAQIILESLTGNVTLETAGTTRSKISVEGDNLIAGELTITSANNAILDGNLDAHAAGEDSEAGTIRVFAFNNLVLSQILRADSTGIGSQGGDVTLSAGNQVDVTATIDASGGDFGGGSVSVSAIRNISLGGLVDMTGAGPDGEGGEGVFTSALGSISLLTGARIRGKGGSGTDFDCGDGSPLLFTAGVDLTLSDDIDVAGGLTCAGGDVDISVGRDFVMNVGSEISTVGPGEGLGGGFFLTSGGDAMLRKIDASGGCNGLGGTVEAAANGTLQVIERIDASASCGFGVGGFVQLTSCAMTVEAAAGFIDTRGPFVFSGFGVILLRASGLMTIAGDVRAAFANIFEYRSIVPSIAGTADVVPDPIIDQNPTLVECVDESCGDGTPNGDETCDDGNTLACDGCSADCSRVDDVCGDGTRECGEQCDDGNDVEDDGCEPDCTPTRQDIEGVRLRGTGRFGCQAEFLVKLTNPKVNSKTGQPISKQECVDGDFCDADETKNNQCVFTTDICINAIDDFLPECMPTQIQWIDLRQPRVNREKDAADEANVATLLNALAPFNTTIFSDGVTVSTGQPVIGADRCTGPFELLVPFTGSTGKKSFKLRTQNENEDRMKKNQVELRCLRNDAVCGNGATEAGERCDDSNLVDCDGCSSSCRVEVCGNGTLECGEQCDAGESNGDPESRCSADCRSLPPPDIRIPGGGTKSKDCPQQWSMEIDADALARNSQGIPKTQQICHDNDPTCDLNPAVGTCQLRVWNCLGAANAALGCSEQAVSALEARQPKTTSKRPHEVAARAALDAALAEFSLPAGPGEECNSGMTLDLPVGPAMSLKLKATMAVGEDSDTLKLRCMP